MTTDRRSILGGAGAIAGGFGLASPAQSEPGHTDTSDPKSPRVLGLGGVFLKVDDPKAWRAWYARVLGVRFADFGSAIFAHPHAGFTQITPFADTSYFKPSKAPFMINLIVENIDGLVARAAEQGAPCLGRQEESYGRFAWLLDPAGIKVELWEPLGHGGPPASQP